MQLNEAYLCLRKCFEHGSSGQAYLIVAPPRGAGIELAERVLQKLFCVSADKGDPCGECRGCRSVAGRSHPDIMWIEPQTKSRSIPIEEIRGVSRRISQTAYSGDIKAVVISSAERMTREAANAFLKTLEEPAGRTFIMLISDAPQSLLSTIVSRCRRIAVSGTFSVLKDEWKEKLYDVVCGARGNSVTEMMAVGDVMSGLLKEIKHEIELEEQDAGDESGRDADDKTVDARVDARYREIRSELIRLLLHIRRDILLLAAGADESAIYNSERLEWLRESAEKIDYRRAVSAVSGVEAMNEMLERNLQDAQVLSVGISRMG